VAIFADDLTGALDSVEPFCRAGASAIVAASVGSLSTLPFTSCDVIAINLDSRNMEPSTASAVTKRAWSCIAPWQPELLFKKVDSRMKGNVVAELQAITKVSERARALVAPAIPLIGRLTHRGKVTGFGVDHPIPICGLPGWLPEWEVPDCLTSEALGAIAKRVLASRKNAIAVGASGLAEALAEILSASEVDHPGHLIAVPPDGRRMVMAIGSRDPITLNQIATLAHSEVPFVTTTCGEGLYRPNPHTDLIVLRPPTTALDPDTVARELADCALKVARQESISTVLLSGGDTAAAFVSLAGIDHLTPLGALAQGMPVSRGHAKGTEFTLITKSGGFGGPDALVEAFRNWQGIC
jgi:uncharacterized protein YgbK (DUF1537 family)